MSAKWWTALLLVAGAKVYLIVSWLSGGDPNAHATQPHAPPAAPHAARAQTKSQQGAKGGAPDVQTALDVDEAAEKLAAAPHDAKVALARGSKAFESRDATTTTSGKPDLQSPERAAPSALTQATPSACLAALRAVESERKAIAARRAEVAKAERAIADREAKAAAALASAKALLENAQATVERAVTKRDEARAASIGKLSKLLAGMRPPEAASLVARIAVAHAVDALSAMEESKAGKILGFVPPDHAARISESMLVGGKPTPASPAGKTPSP